MDYVSKIFEAKTPDEYCQMLATSPGKLREDVPEKSLDRKEALETCRGNGIWLFSSGPCCGIKES